VTSEQDSLIILSFWSNGLTYRSLRDKKIINWKRMERWDRSLRYIPVPAISRFGDIRNDWSARYNSARKRTAQID